MGLSDSLGEWTALGVLIDRPTPSRVSTETAFRRIPDQQRDRRSGIALTRQGLWPWFLQE